MGRTLSGVITCDSCGALIRDVTGRYHVSGTILAEHKEYHRSLPPHCVGLVYVVTACTKCPRSVPRGPEDRDWNAHVEWVKRKVTQRCCECWEEHVDA